MKIRLAITRWIFLAAAMAAAPAAFAQAMYRCTTASGTYVSDRPCAGVAPTVLKAYGPVPERPTYNATPAMGKAPEILPYLSPECAQMNDAVRTGPARGLKGASMSELTANYQQRCAEDEQQARQKLNQVKGDERHQRQLAQASQNAEQARAKLSVEQCNEMLRVLAGRRQRATAMTPGEQNDLQLFEASYRARCKSN